MSSPTKTTHATVRDFLSQRTLAVVGASRNGEKFGNTIYRTLKEKGYRVFAVNPNTAQIEGDPCYRSLADLPDKVGGVVICVPPDRTEQLVKEAHGAGIERVWMQQGAGSYAAIRYCEKNEMQVVHGQCILMFAEPIQFAHRLHAWVWKLIGKYPPAQSIESPKPHS